MHSDEVRGVLNSSSLALHAAHGVPLTIFKHNGRLMVRRG